MAAKRIINTAEAWAEEGQRKYGAGAIAWLRRWKVNCENSPADLKELDEAIAILSKTRARSTIG